MSPLLHIASAQLVNLALGFVIALAAALLVMRIAPTESVKKWCLCLPVVKALAIVVAGVPSGAYVISPHVGQRWELGSFQLGLGFERPLLVPRFVGRLAALKSDEWYGLSMGDGVTHFFVTRGWGALPLVVLSVVVVVSLLRALSWLSAWRRSHARDRANRAQARRLTEHTVLGRRIPVLVRADDQPTAVSGGLSPVIWLSRAVAQAEPEVRRAAIEHELGHVRHADVLLFAGLSLFRAVFWFLPGVGWLERRIRKSAELAADAAAVRHGASSLALAQAILCEGEARASSVALGGSTALERVKRLTSAVESSSTRRRMRVLLAGYVAIGLMASQFGGYH